MASSARAAVPLLLWAWLAQAGPARCQEIHPAPGAAAPGAAEDPVQQHVVRARAHFNAGRYDQAIQELWLAYRLRPDPAYLFSIGQSHRRRGELRQALAAYQLFLRRDPDTPLRAETTNYVTEIVTVLREQERLENERRRPLWKKPWFWGVLASAAAGAGVALGVGLGLGVRDDTPVLMFNFPGNPGTTAGALTRRR